MEGSRFHASLAILATLAVAAGAQAVAISDISEIQVDAFDGISDATYVNKVLTYHTDDLTGYNMVTVSEAGVPLTGWTANTSLTLSSTFQDYAVSLPTPPRALFQGGNMELTFDYSDNNGGSWSHHILSGPISQASVEITSTSPTLSTLTGIFNFNTAQGQVNLPRGDTWPATGLSTAVSLTFAIGADLTPLRQDPAAWQQDIVPSRQHFIFDTQFGFFPEQRPIPEPTVGLLFLAASGLVIVRRRR